MRKTQEGNHNEKGNDISAYEWADTEEEIKATRDKAVTALEADGYEVINTYFDDEWAKPENMTARGVTNIPVAFLAKSIEAMATIDAIYFCKGWNKMRGCKIEHEIALQYGITSIYEDDNFVVD